MFKTMEIIFDKLKAKIRQIKLPTWSRSRVGATLHLLPRITKTATLNLSILATAIKTVRIRHFSESLLLIFCYGQPRF